MNLTRQCLNNPAAVAVMMVMVVLMGFISIGRLPVTLLPSIERPVLSVFVNWRGASPREVESELIEPIERELRGLPAMRSMTSSSNSANGFISMEFSLGTDMDQTFTEITSRLQRVQNLPVDADRPRISKGRRGNDAESLIYLFVQQPSGAKQLPMPLGDFIETRIAPEFEKIDGISGVEVNRNDGQQIVKVEFDPLLAAQLGIDVNRISQTVNRSTDVSGGRVEVGRREVSLRFEGRFSADELEQTILAYRNDAPVRLGDVATVAIGPDRRNGIVIQNGNPALGMRVLREPGANTLKAITELTNVLDELNRTTLAPYGITIAKSFDPSVFINRAIALLGGNLVVGITLAVGVLWLFIRRLRATLLIAAAIPICLLGTIIVLNLFGRSLNIISLAGLAFATGMVLDAAIVVLENFVRLRETGLQGKEAAGKAVSQVGGALFASTVTTVAIFIPIMFFEDIEGQLFADLAFTIAVAVSLSLLVALTVLPTGASTFIRAGKKSSDGGRAAIWETLADKLMTLTGNPRRRLFFIGGLTILPIALVVMLWPQLNYLPPVKRDAVDARVSLPSGAGVDTVKAEFVDVVVERLRPYLEGEREPALRNYYFFAGSRGGNLGIRVKDQSRVEEMTDIIRNEIVTGFPDVRAFVQQRNLFGGFGGNASISIDLQSNDELALNEAAIEAAQIIREILPGATVRPNPDPQVVQPEIRLIPDDRRIAEVGLTRDGVSRIVRALGNGLFLGEFFHDGERIDIFLRAKEWTKPEYLDNAPIPTPLGGIVSLGELATIGPGVGPNQVRRLDGRRTISLGINPPRGMALGTAVDILQKEANPRLYEILPTGGAIKYGGDADSLNRAIGNLGNNFLLAVVLLMLIMSALFKSVKDSLLVIITLPMAAVGGVLVLRLVDMISPTPLDLLGMIGFIILLGLVVNNAILLVAQTRASEAEGFSRRDAVREALKLRIRPIFMSTATSLMGMLPLLLAPGTGSVVYRGLAAVIVGGMAVSTLFTLVLLPSLLQVRWKIPFQKHSDEDTTVPSPTVAAE